MGQDCTYLNQARVSLCSQCSQCDAIMPTRIRRPQAQPTNLPYATPTRRPCHQRWWTPNRHMRSPPTWSAIAEATAGHRPALISPPGQLLVQPRSRCQLVRGAQDNSPALAPA
uniref:Uncharacterized protein n=1 Tax=Hyaloperonospora arabidopsidis (strain Emoy2) TaxID=559515 RepID=M4B9X1_HYAAE